ncbi:hypothetical protein RFI_15356 [Reticulomyxa filosa]|uniref:Uncharacterized protein n=1 Tax=Reticulomyxa filosa TaxID=46433 RepID=X6N746_RETFI|nr:hypothetical protein RFI_15356 [Reticulomyxa filosa]|eukprot:ETO21851.1 hypothetical protein RFI_15356 [Reticulomyxa filosa]
MSSKSTAPHFCFVNKNIRNIICLLFGKKELDESRKLLQTALTDAAEDHECLEKIMRSQLNYTTAGTSQTALMVSSKRHKITSQQWKESVAKTKGLTVTENRKTSGSSHNSEDVTQSSRKKSQSASDNSNKKADESVNEKEKQKQRENDELGFGEFLQIADLITSSKSLLLRLQMEGEMT